VFRKGIARVKAVIDPNKNKRASIINNNVSTGGCRKMHTIHHNFHSSANIMVINGVFWGVMPCGSCKNRHCASVAGYS
jgi:hypothetical protein